jgi:hypothetical protein
MTDPTDTAADGDEPTAVPGAPTAHKGSAPLEVALAARDVEAIGRALRLDHVVVPLLRREDGTTEIRIFDTAGATADQPQWELCVFSSTEAFATFIGDASGHESAIHRGSSLASFLAEHVDVLSAVTFDPRSAHAMTAPPAAVLAILEPRPDDVDVERVAPGVDGAESNPGLPGGGPETGYPVTGFTLPLTGGWLPINLVDEVERRVQIATLVGVQLGRIRAAPALRPKLTAWLTESCARAVDNEARFLAYLLQSSDEGTVAVDVVVHWQELGTAVSTVSHLDRVGGELHSSLREGAELLETETPEGSLLRHSRIAASDELGTATQPLFLVDYWLEFPDPRGLCLITFSSPQVAQAELLLTLTDSVVMSGTWVREAPANLRQD